MPQLNYNSLQRLTEMLGKPAAPCLSLQSRADIYYQSLQAERLIGQEVREEDVLMDSHSQQDAQ